MTWSTPARPPRSCARYCRARTSPRSTPSPWAGRWSTPSSPKCPRTLGSTFPGTLGSPSSRPFAKADCRAKALAIRYDVLNRDRMNEETSHGCHHAESQARHARHPFPRGATRTDGVEEDALPRLRGEGPVVRQGVEIGRAHV